MATVENKESVVVRFAGDSGDGIQVAGLQFSNDVAFGGNDLVTFPSFPAEIRAPAGSVSGVSSFQIHLGNYEVSTPGDSPDVLVSMNPAALKRHLSDLRAGGVLVVNSDAFTDKNLAKADYTANPLVDGTLVDKYRVISVPMSQLCKDALVDTGLSASEIERCKNFFALGLTLFLFNRSADVTIRWIERKFQKNPKVAEANRLALLAGLSFAESTELFDVTFEISPADHAPGSYKNISGSTALGYGLVAAAARSGRDLFYAAYPITPASEMLHDISSMKHPKIKAIQTEDEIAAACAAIGAAYAGALAVTGSSGPGMALKAEALGLAVIAELTMVIVDVQRSGPSTGIPTCSEQTDLNFALYGRHGESPIPVLAASSPNSAFEMAYEACRIAVKFMTPVILLSEGTVANTVEPWRIRNLADLRAFEFPRAAELDESGKHLPYKRDEFGARPWTVPGTPGFIFRTGGLEKQNETGALSYDAANHELMTSIRAAKIAKIAEDIPPLAVDGAERGDLLVLGWGSTEGSIKEAVRRLRLRGIEVSRAHLSYVCPFPANFEQVLKSFDRVLLPELNLGQLAQVIRGQFGIEVISYARVTGQPLKVADLEAEIEKAIAQRRAA